MRRSQSSGLVPRVRLPSPETLGRGRARDYYATMTTTLGGEIGKLSKDEKEYSNTTAHDAAANGHVATDEYVENAKTEE